ncbi:MAG: polyprenyl synthetase family protein [Pseudomonadota bacterium]
MAFKSALAEAQSAVQTFLKKELSAREFGPMGAPMEYALLNGGKRLRAFLVIETARLYSVPLAQALYAAGAIECIHAYSLVHDDLPAMDDDDLRRGKPTVHMKWDEATGILVGDGLQSFAFELLSNSTIPNPAIRSELVLSIARAAGASGMVLGQALDIAAEAGGAQDIDTISAIQRAKTGALIEWSAEAGPKLAGCDPKVLGSYARHIGLAFQIQDDVLDVEGSEAQTGKRLQKDAAAGKATFVSLFGLEGAKSKAKREVEQAVLQIENLDGAENLRDLAQFIIRRDK